MYKLLQVAFTPQLHVKRIFRLRESLKYGPEHHSSKSVYYTINNAH